MWKRLRACPERMSTGHVQEFNDVCEYTRGLLRPRFSFGRYKIIKSDGGILELKGGYCFRSNDLVKLTSESFAVAVIATTVGDEVNDLVQKYYEQGRLFAMAVADAVSSVAVEELICYVYSIIPKANEITTRRVSPGYGDFELSSQDLMLRLSKGYDLGISLTENYMLIPRKSITAIVGLNEALS